MLPSQENICMAFSQEKCKALQFFFLVPTLKSFSLSLPLTPSFTFSLTSPAMVLWVLLCVSILLMAWQKFCRAISLCSQHQLNGLRKKIILL